MKLQVKSQSDAPHGRVQGVVRAATGAQAARPPLSGIADTWFDLSHAEATGSAVPSVARAIPDTPVDGTSRLLGIVGKCRVPGCDVHMLSMEHEILRHLPAETATPPGFQEARAYWSAPHDAAVAVLVYTDRMEVLLMDGSVLPLSTSSR
jgi:hypothetical protein